MILVADRTRIGFTGGADANNYIVILSLGAITGVHRIRNAHEITSVFGAQIQSVFVRSD